jgi:hypothetical protein
MFTVRGSHTDATDERSVASKSQYSLRKSYEAQGLQQLRNLIYILPTSSQKIQLCSRVCIQICTTQMAAVVRLDITTAATLFGSTCFVSTASHYFVRSLCVAIRLGTNLHVS